MDESILKILPYEEEYTTWHPSICSQLWQLP